MAKKPMRSKSRSRGAPAPSGLTKRAAGRSVIEDMPLGTLIRRMSDAANEAGGKVALELRFEPASRTVGASALDSTAKTVITAASGIRLVRFKVEATSGASLLGVQVDMLTIPLERDGNEWKGERTIAVEENFVVVFVKANSPDGESELELTVTAGDKKVEFDPDPFVGPFHDAKPLVLS